MNQNEASGSDDDMSGDEEHVMDELAAAVIESEGALPVVDPRAQREQDIIIAEVARRREQQNTTRHKSDEIFERFDADGDGFLNYLELRALGKATGGDLPEAAYVAVCGEIGANPSKGVTKALLLTMYTDAGLGDAHRDYNLIFRGPGLG